MRSDIEAAMERGASNAIFEARRAELTESIAKKRERLQEMNEEAALTFTDAKPTHPPTRTLCAIP